jgi:hypothetical protein
VSIWQEPQRHKDHKGKRALQGFADSLPDWYQTSLDAVMEALNLHASTYE